MSRASIQSLSLLATVSGTMKVLESLENKENTIHYRFMKPHITATRESSDNAVYKWDCNGDELKNAAKIVKHMQAWDKYMDENGIVLTPLILVSVALQCVLDLHTKVQSSSKKALLDPILDNLKKVSDYLDPHGDKFDDYEKADEILSKLYEMTGFYL